MSIPFNTVTYEMIEEAEENILIKSVERLHGPPTPLITTNAVKTKEIKAKQFAAEVPRTRNKIPI